MGIDRLSLERVAWFRRAVADQALRRVGQPYVGVCHDRNGIVGPGTSDSNGYDCSGLVIASLCAVMKVSPSEAWRPDTRSLRGMSDALSLRANSTARAPLGSSKPEVGSVMIKDIPDPDGFHHCAILTAINQNIRGSGLGHSYVHSVRPEGVVLEDKPYPPRPSPDTVYINPVILALLCLKPKFSERLKRKLNPLGN